MNTSYSSSYLQSLYVLFSNHYPYNFPFCSQLIDQLAAGGRMVIPVGPEDVTQVMVIVDKKENGEIVRTTDTSVRFIPLTDRGKQEENV